MVIKLDQELEIMQQNFQKLKMHYKIDSQETKKKLYQNKFENDGKEIIRAFFSTLRYRSVKYFK